FGTPEFAVPSLEALIGEGFAVVAVVTQPDKPQGRSRSTAVPPPVKTAAEAEDVPVLQPARPSDPDFVERLRGLAPDVGVVVAYGHILKPELLALPRRGMINLHPSLLPELRGAAPVEWAILNGLTQTGVTIMRMEEGLDSGPILLQIPHDIDPDETGGELAEHLSEMGAQALVEVLALFQTNGLEPRLQDHPRATYAPKLPRDTAHIRWPDPAERVARLIHRRAGRPPGGLAHRGAGTGGRGWRAARVSHAGARALGLGALRPGQRPRRLCACASICKRPPRCGSRRRRRGGSAGTGEPQARG